jgi:uncharacterized protein YecT (DUF1311 family)
MMKRNLPASILAGALALALLLPGCSLFHSAQETSSAPEESSSSSASSQTSSLPASSGESVSSADSAVVSDPSDSQPGRVLKITTDNEAFDQKFGENPLDQAYIKESDQAVSTVEMVNVLDQFSALWEKEITHAWSQLQIKTSTDSSNKPAALKAEQQKWEAGKDAALKKIADDSLSAGGSMAVVDAASEKMDFYRSRAAQLYRALYEYDKNYSYAYSAE